MNVRRFQSMPMDGERSCVYDTGDCVDRLSAVGGWVNCCMHWGGPGAVLCSDVETFVDMPFLRVQKKRLMRVVYC